LLAALLEALLSSALLEALLSPSLLEALLGALLLLALLSPWLLSPLGEGSPQAWRARRAARRRAGRVGQGGVSMEDTPVEAGREARLEPRRHGG
jgi:hypothetical protein